MKEMKKSDKKATNSVTFFCIAKTQNDHKKGAKFGLYSKCIERAFGSTGSADRHRKNHVVAKP